MAFQRSPSFGILQQSFFPTTLTGRVFYGTLPHVKNNHFKEDIHNLMMKLMISHTLVSLEEWHICSATVKCHACHFMGLY
jgi:hypothetical protein